MTDEFKHRIATRDDLEALHALMERSIAQNQSDFLTPQQVAASGKVMGLDTQLVRDGTYFLIECEDAARTAGFRRVELMGTAAGVPLYRAQGYTPAAEQEYTSVGDVEIPLLRMEKHFD